MMTACYLHDVLDPNETHYDPQEHGICMVCSTKLWEIAQQGLEFEMREQIVAISTSSIDPERDGLSEKPELRR